MPGAVYLYMGEELGLPEVLDLPDDAREDPVFFRTGGAADRVATAAAIPMPWTAARRRRVRVLADRRRRPPVAAASRPTGARTPSTARTPTPASMLALYRRLIAARRRAARRRRRRARSTSTTTSSSIRRGDVVVACNVGPRAVPCVAAAAGLVAVPSTTGDGADGDRPCPADTTVWFVADRLVASARTMLLANIITDLTDWLEDVSAEWWFLLVILGIAFLDSVIPIVPERDDRDHRRRRRRRRATRTCCS